jgi:hypothetical protein
MPPGERGYMKKSLTVLGALAVVLAITLPATASHLHRVFSKDIVNGTIRSEDIHNGTLRSWDLARGSIGSGRIADGSVRLGDLTKQSRDDLMRTADVDSVGHLLYVENGAAEIAHLTFRVRKPVALEDFDLTFFQELVYGTGSFGANVILGIDANEDGRYRADDLGWHDGLSGAKLRNDTFVELDGLAPTEVKVDAPNVPQWYTPNQAGDGFAQGTSCYATLADLASCDGGIRFDANDKVHVVRILLGGSSSWNDIAVRVTAPFVAGRFETNSRTLTP